MADDKRFTDSEMDEVFASISRAKEESAKAINDKQKEDREEKRRKNRFLRFGRGNNDDDVDYDAEEQKLLEQLAALQGHPVKEIVDPDFSPASTGDKSNEDSSNETQESPVEMSDADELDSLLDDLESLGSKPLSEEEKQFLEETKDPLEDFSSESEKDNEDGDLKEEPSEKNVSEPDEKDDAKQTQLPDSSSLETICEDADIKSEFLSSLEQNPSEELILKDDSAEEEGQESSEKEEKTEEDKNESQPTENFNELTLATTKTDGSHSTSINDISEEEVNSILEGIESQLPQEDETPIILDLLDEEDVESPVIETGEENDDWIEVLDVMTITEEIAPPTQNEVYLYVSLNESKGVANYLYVLLSPTGERKIKGCSINAREFNEMAFSAALSILTEAELDQMETLTIHTIPEVAALLKRNAAYGIVDGYTSNCASYVAKARDVSQKCFLQITGETREALRKYVDIAELTLLTF